MRQCITKGGAVSTPLFFLSVPLTSYIFQFGRFPQLSEAEIRCRLPHFAKKREICPGFFSFSTENEKEIKEHPQRLLDSLGGSIRIAKEYGEGKNPQSTLEGIIHLLTSTFPEGKIQFGISVFRHHPKWNKFFQVGIKKELKNRGRSSRCVNRGTKNLDAGTLHKEGFFRKKNRIEILIFPQKNGNMLVAHTRAAQNVEAFAERDYQKPERDMVVGMLPPKIALLLLNLSATRGKLPKRIWDPFCGTGTIAVEAARLAKESIGTDISPKMVDAAQKNFFHFFQEEGNFFVHDATRTLPSEVQKMLTHDTTIVSEGFLGPIFGKPLRDKEYQKAKRVVEPVMTGFFRAIAAEKKITKMVICLPFWKLANKKNGFCKNTLAQAEKIWKNALAFGEKTPLGGLLYRRDDQIVGRHILVLERR